jgi:hypothetical protein
MTHRDHDFDQSFDESNRGEGRHRTVPRRCSEGRVIATCVAVVLLVAVVGCSSKSSTSASSTSTTAGSSSSTTYPTGKEQVCQARDQLKSSVTALTKPTLLAGGATSIKAAADKVKSDLTDLKAAVKDDYKPPVDAVQTSVDDLETAAGALGNGDVTQNLKAVGTAIATVGTTTSDLFTQLKTACGS